MQVKIMTKREHNVKRWSKVSLSLVPLCFLPLVAEAATLPIVVSASQNLNFGSFYMNGASGDVIINTAGVRSVAGGAMAVTGSGLEGRGEISITASTGVLVTIAMTAPSFNLINGAGDIIVVDDFQLDTPTGGNVIIKSLTATPSVIPFGATLNVPGASPDGTYIGTYGVSVVYQ